jgi:hypothetical protein
MAIEIITTVLSPAASYNLIDLPTVHDEMQIPATDTSNDAWLNRGIAQVSRAIANYCNRVFPVETVQDLCYPERDAYPYQVPGGVRALQLRRWPILPAAVKLPTSADTPSGAVLPFASASAIVAGMPAYCATGVSGLPASAYVSSVASGSATLSAPVTADVPAGTSVNFGPCVTINDPLGTVTTLVNGTDYQVDAKKGWLIRLSPYTGYPTTWDPVQTTVTYQAGYATIPDDLVDAALRVMTQRWQDRGRDPFLKSQDQPGLGTQTFWIGTRPGVKGVFTEEIAGMLDSYRVPVTA